MALPDLIARLERDADAQVEAITRRAKAEVRALDAAAAEAAAGATASHLEQQRLERHAEHIADLARARRRARAEELDARRALLARILERARAGVEEAGASPSYAAALPAHLDEALSYLEGRDVRVRCRTSDAAVLRSIAAGRGHVELAVDDAMGPGLIAEAADGSVVVDNTLAARLTRMERSLAIELLGEVGRVRE